MGGPLEGIRIVEMGQLIAIPYPVKLLADMGAQVIRLESCQRLETYRSDSLYPGEETEDFWNRGANFYEQNRNKLGITLDLSQPAGISILKELLSISDVFAVNFTRRVLKHFHLEYEDLCQLNPDIVMVSSTGYGYTGPWAGFGATGPATEGASGLAFMTGYPDGPPMMPEIPYSDYTAGEHTAFAVMAALINRRRTGQGQFIDVSQTQATSSTIPEALMDFAVNGRTQERMGNEDLVMAPHSCYPCRGDDRWIVISVTDDREWQALCLVLRMPIWIDDVRFRDGLSRWRYRAELDQLIANTTEQWDAHELMNALQCSGVAAGAVLDGKSLLMDPHLVDRAFYEVIMHHPQTKIPPLPYASRPWKMAGIPSEPSRAAPLMGEHNEFIFSQLLGHTDDELTALEVERVIGYAPINPSQVRRPSPVEQVHEGRMQRYESDYQEQVKRVYRTKNAKRG
jgi:crotonobetainyl-CoA:carnitine CoA-transferase CaiB-like acyl-CoA transferase